LRSCKTQKKKSSSKNVPKGKGKPMMKKSADLMRKSKNSPQRKRKDSSDEDYLQKEANYSLKCY
jgi:hypothetical protein